MYIVERICRRRAVSSLLLVIGFILWPMQFAGAVEDAQEIQRLIQAGDLEQALLLTDAQLQADRGDITYRFLKGLILTKMNQLQQAAKIFEELTVEHPDLPEPYNNLAVVYAAQGDFDKAQTALLRAINTHPSYATAHENMGDIYAKMASQAYNQALQLDTDNSSAKAKLALINDLFSVPKSSPAALRTAAVSMQDTVGAGRTVAPAPAREYPVQSRVIDHPMAKVPLSAGVSEEQLVAEVEQTLHDWAGAWSGKDITGYLAAYGGEFRPPGNMTRKQWEAARQRRLSRPKFINIDVSDLDIEIYGDDHARATFLQGYRSNTYSDQVRKTLIFKKQNNRWLISDESVN